MFQHFVWFKIYCICEQDATNHFFSEAPTLLAETYSLQIEFLLNSYKAALAVTVVNEIVINSILYFNKIRQVVRIRKRCYAQLNTVENFAGINSGKNSMNLHDKLCNVVDGNDGKVTCF